MSVAILARSRFYCSIFRTGSVGYIPFNWIVMGGGDGGDGGLSSTFYSRPLTRTHTNMQCNNYTHFATAAKLECSTLIPQPAPSMYAKASASTIPARPRLLYPGCVATSPSAPTGSEVWPSNAVTSSVSAVSRGREQQATAPISVLEQILGGRGFHWPRRAAPASSSSRAVGFLLTRALRW